MSCAETVLAKKSPPGGPGTHIPKKAPTISSVSPTGKVVGSGAFTLTVNGANFAPGIVVYFNASPRATTFLSASQVTASMLASDVAKAGSFSLVVSNAGSKTGQIAYVVNKANTVTTLGSSPDPLVSGQPVTFTATISVIAPGSGTPAGTVTFKDGSATLATSTLSGGKATATATLASGGSHSITAVYNGDANYNGSASSPPLVPGVVKSDTTTTVSSSVNPSVFGQAVTLRAKVSAAGSGAGTPSGTVQFQTNGVNFGNAVVLSGGTASSAPLSTLEVGSSTAITAIYSGDGYFNGSDNTALPLMQTINPANTTAAVSASAGSSVFGQPVTFTATVSAAAPSTGTPSGTVTFMDGASSLGTRTLSSGQAGFTFSSLGVGPHSITAVYNGDGNFNGSSSPARTQNVTLANSTTTVSASANPAVSGQSVTFTVTVNAVAPGNGTPSGAVTFKDGAAILGTGSLSSGQATFTSSSLGVGAHTITAVYGGDSSFTSSVSPGLTQTVNKASTSTMLASSANPAAAGQPVTFTASVGAVAPGSGTPTGTVTFKDGTTVLATSSLAGGQAAYTSSALSSSTHQITAVYSGDSSFNGSASAPLSQTISKTGPKSGPGTSGKPSLAQATLASSSLAIVAPPAPVITSLRRQQDGNMAVQCSGVASQRHLIQASTDLHAWTTLATIAADAKGSVQFVDLASTNYPCRFYRAGALSDGSAPSAQ